MTAPCGGTWKLPAGMREILEKRHAIIKTIRCFFESRGYIEVETPLMVPSPGFDPYIEAFSTDAQSYLATSPELQMKRLVQYGLDAVYQITHAFRRDEQGVHHNREFTMLEWYRTGADYKDMMIETEDLLSTLGRNDVYGKAQLRFPIERTSVSELFRECAGWDPCRQWDEDRYFRDWVVKIDPALQHRDCVFVTDFPSALAALSQQRDDIPACQRFELFIKGVEIGNAYTELLDHEEHIRRFERTASARDEAGKMRYPADEKFLEAVRHGLPACSGMAVGVDRLVMSLLGLQSIDQVMAFPECRL